MKKKEAIERAKNAEILMLVNYPFDKESIESCPNLRMISVAFTGFDHVDTEECKKKILLFAMRPVMQLIPSQN